MGQDWKLQAEVLFFGDGEQIVAISAVIGISVRSISAYLNSLPHYADEVGRRKKSKENRTTYYRTHKQKTRERVLSITSDTLKKEHIQAVKILSKERFFHE